MVDIMGVCQAIPGREGCWPGVRLRIKEDAVLKRGHAGWIYFGGAEEAGGRFGGKRRVDVLNFYGTIPERGVLPAEPGDECLSMKVYHRPIALELEYYSEIQQIN